MKICHTVFIFVLLIPLSLQAQDPCNCCDVGQGYFKQARPDDPWTQGRFWLRQTGHFGRFYNCDCEEEKRFSPYICWKRTANPFTGFRIRDCIRCDLFSIRRRIRDGAGECCGRSLFRIPWRSCHCKKCE